MISSFKKTLGELFLDSRGLDSPNRGRVVNDSRKVLPGDTFVAITGLRQDGHEFVDQAIRSGAQVVIHDRDLPGYNSKTTYIRVSDSGRAYSRLEREYCNRPDETVALIGVTGTNGKTTTAFLVEHLFQHAGVPCGLISTVEQRDGKIVRPSAWTTPEAGVFFPLLQSMRRNGMRAAAVELSSHALFQGRVDGAKFRTAIFTNLTGEHLDYHGDMEHYYRAKKLFFTTLLGLDGTAVLNIDDSYGRRIAREIAGRNVITFGTSAGADWRIDDIKLRADGSSFRLIGEEIAYEAATNLIGEYNIHNLAGALVAALDYGIPAAALDRALSFSIRVPGRLERFNAPGGAVFYVDYAHTDDALANVLGTLRNLTAGRLIAVFGAGGDRDRTKRPRMGKVAARTADFTIVTSDNPRNEEPEAIISEIVAGIPAGSNFEIEPDRRKAIARAVELAAPGDIVLVAGKGHENTQEIKGVRHHFDDREVLKELLG